MNNAVNIRQGDLILTPATIPSTAVTLEHLTLALGEVTGHSHRITSGHAALLERDSAIFLRVSSSDATLSHDEHAALAIPQGEYAINIQREYAPEGWAGVRD
jgi:hypothetical protein